MEDNEFYNFLFEQKINKGLFDMNEKELTEQKNMAKESQKELINFIDTILDSDNKEILLELLENRDNNYNECFFLEQRLFYRNGIKDGISIIVSAITHK